MTPRVALAVSAGAPGVEASNELVVGELAKLGVEGQAAIWDDDVAWDSFDLVVVRSVLDYSQRREEFLRWAHTLPAVLNPVGILQWNSDKHYMLELEAAGVPVVPTLWLEPEQQLGARELHTRFPSLGDFVIKPAIDYGPQDTGRYTAVDGRSRGLAIDHALWLLSAGRSVLVQRYVKSVDVSGERALYFIDGQYSHALHKEAMLIHSGGAPEAPVTVTPTEATPADIDVARLALKAAHQAVPSAGNDPFLYARVDLITGDHDEPLVLEVELAKSQMKTQMVPEAAGRLASAIANRLS